MSEFVKHDKDKPMFHLIDPYAHEDLAKCLTFGAEKYSANNWKKGDIVTYISAMHRHLNAIEKHIVDGKKLENIIDEDSGMQHGAHLLCNAMFIHYFLRKYIDKIAGYEKIKTEDNENSLGD